MPPAVSSRCNRDNKHKELPIRDLSSFTLTSTVAAIIVRSSTRGRNCFGRSFVEIGQSRVPAPPDRMTGITPLLALLFKFL